MSSPNGTRTGTGLGHGPFDATQLRYDTWSRLLFHANWLHEATRRGGDAGDPARVVGECLDVLRCLERYWGVPGARAVDELGAAFAAGRHSEVHAGASRYVKMIVGESYRSRAPIERQGDGVRGDEGTDDGPRRPYFEVVVVGAPDAADEEQFRRGLRDARRPEDEFIYNVVFVHSFQDAAIAALFNPTVQSVVLRYSFPFNSENLHPIFARYLDLLAAQKPDLSYGLDRSLALGKSLKGLRPDLDLFLVTDAPTDEIAGRVGRRFRRVFCRADNFQELHLSILKGVRERYETPFFDALRRYSQRPTGVFHALPVSRGKSISQSHWIDDMGRFYGQNIFLAETSATSGGLDSLLQPAGPIKRAHKRAAKAFGSDRTFFVTNGTSTANKIVMQALVRPGDIVLVSRDCHKSHHYALMLAGAHPVYLDAYPMPDYSMYGAVPLDLIKERLIELRDAGKLDRVRMVLLTNCTFDGITYNPYKVMKEILEIKPDMIFLWDEAWFAYGYFNPTLRQRTAMAAAKRLRDELAKDDGTEKRVRVYATQSTHKTLTSLRQGSMIHVADDDFEHLASEAFDDAFMTHTSTSPNYQIIASLDLGRRQVELEGYELVQRAMSLAMSLRERVNEHPDVRRYFSVLRPLDMIPEAHRSSGIEAYYDPEQGWARMERAWREDEFCLDPTRVNIHIGRTGIDGDSFRRVLMDDHDIQINKTSRNTALFMTNIGTTRGDIAYLVDSLANIAVSLDDERRLEGDVDASLRAGRVSSLTQKRPKLPGFGRFHSAFSDEASGTPEGDIRGAFFAGSDPGQCEHRSMAELRQAAASGEPAVAGGFVTPYPPGFPVLVPGQVVSAEILDYLAAVDVKEIHGYKEGHGLRVLSAEAIAQAQRARQAASGGAPVSRSVVVGKSKGEEEEASS